MPAIVTPVVSAYQNINAVVKNKYLGTNYEKKLEGLTKSEKMTDFPSVSEPEKNTVTYAYEMESVP